jgi:addiction module HigA family antidote
VKLTSLVIQSPRQQSFFGVTRQQLHRVVKGESSISAEMALRIEAVIGGSADLWLRMQVAYDLAQLRLKTSAHAAHKNRKMVA